MRYALFTGCNIPIKIPWVEKAALEVLERLEIEPVYLEFSCCPNTQLRFADKDSWLSIAARNLAIAEKENLDIISLCPECSNTLLTAKGMLEDPETLDSINKKLAKVDLNYNGKAKVYDLTNFLYKQKEKIKSLVRESLDLSIAIHDGCHIQRPKDVVKFYPGTPDELLSIIGCDIEEYPLRDLCCGFHISITDGNLSDKLTREKIDEIDNSKADALCVLCPLCFIQYDETQKKFDRRIPVFHYLELIAISLGVSPLDIGVRFHKTNAESLLRDKLLNGVSQDRQSTN